MGSTTQQTWEDTCGIWLKCRVSWNISQQGIAARTWSNKPNSWGIVAVQERANCSYWWYWSNVSSGECVRKSEMLSTVSLVEGDALKKTAADNIKKYGENLSSILRQNFYLDDMLKSFPSAKIAVDMIYKVKWLCKEGGFNLAKFCSNHMEVLKSIPD